MFINKHQAGGRQSVSTHAGGYTVFKVVMALAAQGVVRNAVDGTGLGALQPVASRLGLYVLPNSTVALRQERGSIVADREGICEDNFAQ